MCGRWSRDDISVLHRAVAPSVVAAIGLSVPKNAVPSCLHYGGLFIGRRAAEVLGDYGAGPNHVLPTGGTARYTGGLSVMTFLRVRTWMRIDEAQPSQPLVR